MLTTQARNRRGATLPTFAAVLPLILMFAAFAINLAYIQLCRTQMRVAVDAAAHAGGRRMGTPPQAAPSIDRIRSS
jgi:Flp pilus assembly protein TadG